jgi:hypothetical protein
MSINLKHITMKFFLGKFDLLNSKGSIMDAYGNYPLRVDVLAGEAKAIVMNGTIFKNNDLKTQKIYLCMNYVDLVGRNQIKVVGTIPLLQFKELIEILGEHVYSLSEEDEDIRMYRKDCNHVGDEILECKRDSLS